MASKDEKFGGEEEGLLHHCSASQQQPHNANRHSVGALYIIIFGLSAALLYSSTRAVRDPSQLIYSPALEAVQYEVVDFGKFFLRRNEYMGMQGYPTDETDALWTDLYDLGPVGLPPWQANLLENKTEPIPGTETYLVELDVFHQLHCLDRLRRALYPDRYGRWEWKEDGSVNTKTVDFQHWEHCIDALRQTVMCHGDISPLQYRINGINGILAPDLSTRHTCRNFAKIRDWAKSRLAPDFDAAVASGVLQLKPNWTFQDLVDTEVWKEPSGGGKKSG